MKNKIYFNFLSVTSQSDTISIYVFFKKKYLKNNTKIWRKYYFEVKKKLLKFLGFDVQPDTISTYFYKQIIQKHNKNINFKQRKKT